MNDSNIYKIVYFFTTQITSESLKNKFLRWLISPMQQGQKEQALCGRWKESDRDADISTRRSLDEVMRKAGISRKRTLVHTSWVRKFSRIAAMLLIPLVTVIASALYVQKNTQEAVEMIECTILRGELKRVTLSDGTKVMINSESFLIYPKKFYGTTRTVYLSGEANFEVQKDADHPFIVKTAQLAIKALGTKFNVRAYPGFDTTTATLENGSIQVSSMTTSNQVFILKPNEQLEYNHQARTFQKQTVDTKVYDGWTQGKLNFVNCTFAEMLTVIQQHFDAKITADFRLPSADLYTIKFKKGETLRNAIQIMTLTVGGIEAKFTDEKSVELTLSHSSRKKGGERK